MQEDLGVSELDFILVGGKGREENDHWAIMQKRECKGETVPCLLPESGRSLRQVVQTGGEKHGVDLRWTKGMRWRSFGKKTGQKHVKKGGGGVKGKTA